MAEPTDTSSTGTAASCHLAMSFPALRGMGREQRTVRGSKPRRGPGLGLVSSATLDAGFEVDQSVFEISESYHIQDTGRNMHLQDEDYEIMQFAIQQSLLESNRRQEAPGLSSNGTITQPHLYDAQYER
ncbi:ankyrin repeat domain-containing protein 13A-like [Tachyglossus aculeatus]|uniref:ankyrin repeat domain-containing protein 13A-like n=1 Tax=Tachyglossus aculeatus TaxID=9261 RepID=UPI0018F5F83E|nr:ankyrin repeat domain-containing protein 13A-like [Tachyglossus aculeatus]